MAQQEKAVLTLRQRSAKTKEDVSFEAWFATCDDLVLPLMGMRLNDFLGDTPSRSYYDDFFTPKEFVREMLDDAGLDFSNSGREG